MPKNVIVCCDGTANEFAQDRTNVVKLYFTLAQEPKQQVAYYHPGIGTMESPGADTPLRRRVSRTLGMAIALGLERDIRDAYVFLMRYFEPDDRLFMFGFSRGAYTVRAVASLLHMYGLVRDSNEPLVPYAIRLLVGINEMQRSATGPDPRIDSYFRLASEFKAHFSGTTCHPYFVGVWDTVSSVGWIENPTRLPYSASNPDIQIGRHAIAIDERRAFFRTNLWRPASAGGPKDVKQVWFPGVHCDVGGGYPESESGLSKIALAWMLKEARTAGLLVNDQRMAEILGAPGSEYVAPDPKAKMHESLTGAWRLAEFIPKRHYNWATREEERRMNLFRRRTIPSGALVHASAYERGDEYAKRLPADAVRVN